MHITLRLATILACGILLAACTGSAAQGDNTVSTPVTELIKKDTKVGTGADAKPGMAATVHYTGWLHDPSKADLKGAKFDSSRDRNEAFTFHLGAGEVIRGWDDGVVGMKVGGQRTLTIPAKFGYGARGAGGVIPPNATLLFEVELIDVR